jgi:hypothetical protein
MANPDGDQPQTRAVVVRLWLPDRPGALGQVASRVGAVRGDLLAIDILERGGGQVVDELVVSLPAGVPEELLAREIGAVDGVAVEHIRHVAADRPDPAMAMFELGARIAEAPAGEAVELLCDGLRAALDADWAVATSNGGELHRSGEPPASAWLTAFLEGSEHLDDDHVGPGDVMWAKLPASSIVVAAGRAARAAHDRERARLRVLARIVDQLLARSFADGS